MVFAFLGWLIALSHRQDGRGESDPRPDDIARKRRTDDCSKALEPNQGIVIGLETLGAEPPGDHDLCLGRVGLEGARMDGTHACDSPELADLRTDEKRIPVPQSSLPGIVRGGKNLVAPPAPGERVRILPDARVEL